MKDKEGFKYQFVSVFHLTVLDLLSYKEIVHKYSSSAFLIFIPIICFVACCSEQLEANSRGVVRRAWETQVSILTPGSEFKPRIWAFPTH